MSDWLSSTWEASWRPFQYFNFYRLLLGCLILLAALLPESLVASFHLTSSRDIYPVALIYFAVVLAGLMLSIHWQRRFNLQLTVQLFADVIFVSLLMYALGGVSSGMGVLLLISLAAASLVGRGRLVLFYAALATLATLLVQIYGVLNHDFDAASIVQAGFLSTGFFATAILARLLGQRLMLNEELARQRGESLDNQSRISQRVIERMQDGVLVVNRDAYLCCATTRLPKRCWVLCRLMLSLPNTRHCWRRRWPIDSALPRVWSFLALMGRCCGRALRKQRVAAVRC